MLVEGRLVWLRAMVIETHAIVAAEVVGIRFDVQGLLHCSVLSPRVQCASAAARVAVHRVLLVSRTRSRAVRPRGIPSVGSEVEVVALVVEAIAESVALLLIHLVE